MKQHIKSKRALKKKKLPAFLSLRGFTYEAARFCQEKGIEVAEHTVLFYYFIDFYNNHIDSIE